MKVPMQNKLRCEHPQESRKLILYDADPDTGEVIEKHYECAECGHEFKYRFRAPAPRGPRRPIVSPRRFHS